MRGILGFIKNIFYFSGVVLLPLGDAMSLIVTAPIIIIILACIFLKEKVTTKQLLLCNLAFLGALFISKPGFLKNILGMEQE